MISFELRKYVEGRWMLDSVFDDKAEAIAEAKSLMARSRTLSAIRVVAVTEDETGFKEWTVYKQTIVDEENEQTAQRAIQTRREVQTARTQRDFDMPKGKGAPKGQRGHGWLYYAGLAARVVAIVGAGVYAIVLMHKQFL